MGEKRQKKIKEERQGVIKQVRCGNRLRHNAAIQMQYVLKSPPKRRRHGQGWTISKVTGNAARDT